MHADVCGDTSNVIGVAGDHRYRLTKGLEHLPEVGIRDGDPQSSANGSGSVRSSGIKALISHSKTVDGGRSWRRSVPSGFHSHRRGDEQTLGAGASQVSAGSRLHQSQCSTMLTVRGISECLHRFVVEHDRASSPHATAAASPAAYKSTSSADGSSRNVTISAAARRMRSGWLATGLPSSSAAARAISPRSGRASG